MTGLDGRNQKQSLGRGCKDLCTTEGMLKGKSSEGTKIGQRKKRGNDVGSATVYCSWIRREATESSAL